MGMIQIALCVVAGAAVATLVIVKLRCELFGHEPGKGYTSREGAGYLALKRGPVDGIQREHAELFSECARCGTRFRVGHLHVHPSGRLLQRSRHDKGYEDNWAEFEADAIKQEARRAKFAS